MIARGLLVLALLGACLSGGPGALAAPGGAAPTYDELPLGAPTTVPWWQHGRLHIGDTVIKTRLHSIASRNGTTVVGPGWDWSGTFPGWFLVRDGRLKRLPMRTSTAKPFVSANGRWISWIEQKAPRTDAWERWVRYRVVIYDVRRHRVANTFSDRRWVDQDDASNGIWALTLSNAGELVFLLGANGADRVLFPRGRPKPFVGPHEWTNMPMEGWPRGTTVHRNDTAPGVFGTIERNGRFVRHGRVPLALDRGLWSPDGSRLISADSTDYPLSTTWVQPVAGAAVQLAVPQEPYDSYEAVGWESPDVAIVWNFNSYTEDAELLRCFTGTGSCERVSSGPRPGALASMPGGS